MDMYQGGIQSPPQKNETPLEYHEVGRGSGIRAARLNRSCEFPEAIRTVLGISLGSPDSEVVEHLIAGGHTRDMGEIQRYRQTTADGGTLFLRSHGSPNYFFVLSDDSSEPVYILATRFGRFANFDEDEQYYSLCEPFVLQSTDQIILNDMPR